MILVEKKLCVYAAFSQFEHVDMFICLHCLLEPNSLEIFAQTKIPFSENYDSIAAEFYPGMVTDATSRLIFEFSKFMRGNTDQR
jgi:hypothetical protein